jgi:hypothetical protein
MLVGAAGLCACLIVMSALSITGRFIYDTDYVTEIESAVVTSRDVSSNVGDIKNEAIAFVAMQYTYVAIFAYTWGPLGWIYPSELYSQGKCE